MKREDIYQLIDLERVRQAKKWNKKHDWGKGDCSSKKVEPITKVGVLTEENGEVAKAVLERDDKGLKKELCQLAACCVAWLESL